MTLIDEYIFNHSNDMSITELAQRIGVAPEFVLTRKQALQKDLSLKFGPTTATEEITALINLIEIRKHGWAVEVAKQRIIEIEKIRNMI